jgi:antitoxin Phd
MENWQLQKAKNHFSDLVRKAEEQGPQTITRHGKAAAVLLSMKDYRNLMKKQESLSEFFRRSPLKGVELDLERRAKFRCYS